MAKYITASVASRQWLQATSGMWSYDFAFCSLERISYSRRANRNYNTNAHDVAKLTLFWVNKCAEHVMFAAVYIFTQVIHSY